MACHVEVTKKNGQKECLDDKKLMKFVDTVSHGLTKIDKVDFVGKLKRELYSGIPTDKIYKAAQLVAKSLIEIEPEYNFLAARCLLISLYKESFGKSTKDSERDSVYREKFKENIIELVNNGRLDAKLLTEYDLDKLAALLKPERDYTFRYISLQTLYDRYFLHVNGRRLETPQAFFMRVAMGVCLCEKAEDRYEWVAKLYEKMSTYKFMPSTPTLFNSGTNNPQLSSCFLAVIDDDLESILGSGCHAQGLLSKWAGGLSASVTRIRAIGSHIKGTNGPSQGIIPFIKIYNSVTHAINQGSRRAGSQCLTLEPWHLEVEDFIDLRKNTGDDRRRCHDLHTALWYSDEFFIRLENNDDWYLFCPSEVPELINNYGEEFSKHYKRYIELAEQGKLKQFKKMKAKDLFKKALISLSETGHPWVTFKDPSNIRYANKHEGIVNNSNLCCMTGDQRVPTNYGLLTVKELFDLQTEVKVVGREQVEYASVMYKPKTNTEIVKIITDEGYEHKVTPDHKVWVKDVGWVEAQHLKEGDLLSIQQIEGLWGKNNYEQEAFLMGMIAGDGVFSKNGVHIDLWEHDFEHIKTIEKIVAAIIEKYKNVVPVIRSDFHKTPKFNITDIEFSKVKKARLTSARLQHILNYLGFNKESKLSIPEIVWKGDKATVTAYLKGIYYCDGTIQAIENNQSVISLTSVSLKLLKDIQILLANYNIKSAIRLSSIEGLRLLPNGKGTKQLYQCQTAYRLLITSIKGCKILNDNIKLAEYRKCPQLLKNLAKDGYIQKLWAKFSKLEKCANEDAYCLRVDSEEHSWTVNGLITKNTEILLHNKPTKYKKQQIVEVGETAVCSLASPNLMAHVKNGKLDREELADTIHCIVRHLDNVVTTNYYPTLETENANLKHRPIGIGLMGWHDYLHSQNLAFDSKKALEEAGLIQEFISYHAIDSSIDLARERGKYSTYEGSTWSQGILPIDTYRILMQSRGNYAVENYGNIRSDMPWSNIRDKLLKHGIRNSCLMAIAPNASNAWITGCSPSIEPDYSVLYTYTNLSGNFTVINEFFVKKMKELGLWNKDLLDKLKLHDGDVSQIPEIPNKIKNEFKTAFQIDSKMIIDIAAERQKWIDMGQSLNLYYSGNSLRQLYNMYVHAWKNGLKTTYYLRSKGATSAEKTTVGLKEILTEPTKSCKISDPDCKSCEG